MTVGEFTNRGGRSRTIHFLRHLLEMVLAMMVGMFAGAAVFVSALGITVEEAIQDHSVSFVIVMAFCMTVPMVAWMRYRGHAWQPSNEMAAAMFLPTFGVIALLWGGVVEDFDTLMMLEHVVMLPAMLVAMLLRRDEYTRGHAHHAIA
jgi:hypothetical protein